MASGAHAKENEWLQALAKEARWDYRPVIAPPGGLFVHDEKERIVFDTYR
jgi:hypothetical protein